MNHKVKEYFLDYVKFDTQSDSTSESYPSTPKQLKLLHHLKTQLEEIGVEDVNIDKYGYVTAIIPSNIEKKVPTILFAAHVDTATEVTGKNVNPQIISNYQGKDLVLKNDESQVIKFSDNPYLKNLISHEIITTDGTTLLGADNKSGVAVIMDAARLLIKNPEIKHGEIKILFNPDEEIGRGTEFLKVSDLNADFGYTLDASDRGEIEYENFNAFSAKVEFEGNSIHPGYAKDKLVNATKLAARFIEMLPNEHSPETTEGYDGFIHVTDVKGNSDKIEINMILRDFDLDKIKLFKEIIEKNAEKVCEDMRGKFQTEFKEQYKNMFEIIKENMKVVEIAKKAMDNLSITPITKPIRGGTDGAMLTHKGLPCPNLFTGQQNYHGKKEYISVQDMEASVKTVVEICKLLAESRD